MIKLVYILVFLSNFLFTQNKWQKFPLNGPKNIMEIHCPDSNNLFLVSSFTGMVHKSTNKGESWQFLFDDHLYFKDFDYMTSFPDSLNYFIPYYGGCGIIKTRDGFNSKDTICNGLINIHNVFKMYDKFIGFTWRFEVDTSGGKTFEKYYYVSTFDGFDTEKKIMIDRLDNQPFMTDAQFLNDSIIFLLNYYIDTVSLQYQYVFESFNLFTQEKIQLSKLNYKSLYLINLFKTESLLFAVGWNYREKNKGTRDFIIKSSDFGKTWKNVLDISYTHKAFNVDEKFSDAGGLNRLAFKNDSVGIAIGSDSKICYTYDAGESWYYEREHSNDLLKFYLFNAKITYAGDTPIYVKYNENLFRMTEDNLAPKPQDTLIISGYVMFEGNPQAEIPVALNNRITMTDSNGYYQFIHIRPNKEFTLQVYNKYYNYRPFFYTPEKIQISTTKDSTINFEAINNKKFHNISGNVYKDWEGLPDIPIISIKYLSQTERNYDTVYTNEEGFYHFENIEEGFNYSYKPISEEYTFDPIEYAYIGITGNQTGYNFHATPHSSVTQNPNFQLRDNVLISEEVAGMNYRIISLSGRVVKSAHLPKELNLNAHPTGTYILNITKGEQVIFTHKFQVVR